MPIDAEAFLTPAAPAAAAIRPALLVCAVSDTTLSRLTTSGPVGTFSAGTTASVRAALLLRAVRMAAMSFETDLVLHAFAAGFSALIKSALKSGASIWTLNHAGLPMVTIGICVARCAARIGPKIAILCPGQFVPATEGHVGAVTHDNRTTYAAYQRLAIATSDLRKQIAIRNTVSCDTFPKAVAGAA